MTDKVKCCHMCSPHSQGQCVYTLRRTETFQFLLQRKPQLLQQGTKLLIYRVEIFRLQHIIERKFCQSEQFKKRTRGILCMEQPTMFPVTIHEELFRILFPSVKETANASDTN